MPVEAKDFKRALATWASGVTVVTTKGENGFAGLTASAFSSVSAEPPLVLVCVNREAESCAALKTAGFFAVNVLAEEQEAVSNSFAFGDKDKRFENLDYEVGSLGAPLINGCLANLECRVVDTSEQGSHCIFIGQVESVRVGESNPLLYWRGGYRSLSQT